MPRGVRAWAPVVLAGVLAALLLSLAWLQWRWLGQISADQRERMQTNLRAQVTQFTQDFDRELTRAYVWLQADRGVTPGVTPPLDSVGHFQRWFASAPHPGLVAQVYVASLSHDGHAGRLASWDVQRYDREREALEPVGTDVPPALAAILDTLTTLPTDGSERGPDRGPGPFVPPIAAGGTALVIARPPVPIVNAGGAIVFSRERRPWDYTIALLDTAFIRESFLPDVLARHFSEATHTPYRVSIVDRVSGAPVFCSDHDAARCAIASPDASEVFFDVRTREFNRFVVDDRRGTQVRANAADAGRQTLGPGGPTLPPHAEGPGGTAPPKQGVSVTVRRGGPEGEPRRPDREPLWRADFAHRAGSLEAAVASTRRRNLFVSSSVILLLGASIGMLVVSSARARTLAAQQMEFVAGVSHELRTPLAVIRSAAENLADGVVADTAQVQRYGQLIADEGRRLTEMVEQVMEFAGFEAGRSLDLRPALAADVARAAIDASGPLLAETDAQVDVEAPETPLFVQADHAALARSVQNLIANAVKYGGTDRWVGVRVAPVDARTVAIAVSDHGPGIPETELARIFEPFYRGQHALDGQIHGSGLGLSLVDRIVRQHGGRVQVQSTPRGTTFTLLLPSAPDLAATAAVEESVARVDTRLEGRGHAS